MQKHCTAGQATDYSIIRRMRFACWVTKTTITHSKYAIHIVYRRQHTLSDGASKLRYTYNPCLVYIKSGGIQSNHWACCKGYKLLAYLSSETKWRDKNALFAITKVPVKLTLS